MPPLSQICPFCGYIEVGERSRNISLDDQLQQIETQALALKNAPRSTHGGALGRYAWVACAGLALQFAIVSLVTESTGLWLLVLLFLLFFAISLIRQLGGKTKTAKNNRTYSHLLAEFETLVRQCLTYYGKNRTIQQQLDGISQEIAADRNRRKQTRRRQTVTALILLTVFLLISGYLTFDFAKYALHEQEEQTMSASSTIEKCLERGDDEMAIRLFLTHHMGKVGDYDYARRIAEQLLRKEKKEDAKAFAEQCSALFHASDQERLRKIVND
jgi:ABC-type transport system involved in cytochrome bd biosynthesis fused ATPase/permease subunit